MSALGYLPAAKGAKGRAVGRAYPNALPGVQLLLAYGAAKLSLGGLPAWLPWGKCRQPAPSYLALASRSPTARLRFAQGPDILSLPSGPISAIVATGARAKVPSPTWPTWCGKA